MWMPTAHPLINLLFAGIFIAGAYLTTARLVAGAIRGYESITTSRTVSQMQIRQRNFEKNHHLVVTPPAKTPVVVISPDSYLREYHGAVPGQRGTVVMVSRVNRGDTGVLVNLSGKPGDMVRMDLHELRLAPDA